VAEPKGKVHELIAALKEDFAAFEVLFAGQKGNSEGDMNTSKLLPMLIVAGALGLPGTCSSTAQDPQFKATFVEISNSPTLMPGVLYEPVAPGEKSHIAIVMMHPDRDYMTHTVCAEMSKRGYRVLCADSTILKTRSKDTALDGIIYDIGLEVAYLRKYPGVQKVVLFGHSGGGTIMSAYQNIAENGLKACQGPEKIYKCSDRLAGLPPADGILLVDSNWGLAAMTLFAVDPAVVNKDDGKTLNPALDMFNPANGFKPTGATYSDEFIHKFLSAEANRYSQLIQAAQDRLKAIDAGKGDYADDEPFVAPGSGLAAPDSKLYAHDVRLMSHTRNAWPLIHADGSITTQVVHSVRKPLDLTSLTQYFEDGALQSTVREFLSMNAVRVTDDYGYDEDSVHGVDWSSSYNCPPGNVRGITVPMLVMGMTGSWEYLSSETIYENAKSTDKTLAFVEGASHMYTTCKDCEKTPGEFGNTMNTTYNYVDKWLSQKGRFMNGSKQTVVSKSESQVP
jgi:pimeloyl-ACP methyl ester carboxylesterase